MARRARARAASARAVPRDAAARGAPGGDPLLFARLRWRRGPGGRRAAARSTRRSCACARCASARARSQRLVLLRERPDDRAGEHDAAPARALLHVAIENPGGLARRACDRAPRRPRAPRRKRRAPALARGLRRRPAGVPLRVGFEAGRTASAAAVRRWRAGSGRARERRARAARAAAARRRAAARRARYSAAPCVAGPAARWNARPPKREWIGAGVPPGLQSRLGFVNSGAGGFDSHALPPRSLGGAGRGKPRRGDPAQEAGRALE